MSPKHYLYQQPKNIFYITSKFSIVGLTKYLASMHGKKTNINCIVNGGIDADQPKKFKKSFYEQNLIYNVVERRAL